MVVGASAVDFTDGEDITHVEAVGTMTALNIINGKDDGSFDPEGTVTRAEMAKMITVALNGGSAPVLGTKGTPTYTDIKGHWAESFIEYCSNLKIINGRGNGIFDPNGNVTGTEAAKMVLVAMGYDSTVFNFTGADWAINVNTEANNATPNKLYAGIEAIDPNAPMTRDAAAQLIYNGVQDHMMVKSPAMTITNGEITWEYSKSGDTILNTKYNANVYTAVVLGNEYVGLTGGKTQPGEIRIQAFQVDGEDVATRNMVLKANASLDMLGKPFKFIVKNTKSGSTYTTVYGDAIPADIGNIYTVSANVQSENTMKLADFREEVEAAGITVASIRATMTTGSGDSAVTTFGPSVFEDFTSTSDIANISALKAATENGKIIEVIDHNGDGNADRILISTPVIGKVTTYNEKGNGGKGYVTVGNITTGAGINVAGEKFENVIGVEDVELNDIVSFIELNGKYFITKLESVAGTVTKQVGDNQITMDGEIYKSSSLTDKKNVKNVTTLKAATSVGEEVTLYLDASGYVVYTTGEDATANYMYVYAIESVGDITGVKARAAFTDGSTTVITITSIKDGSGTEHKLDSNTNKLTAYVNDANGTIRPKYFNDGVTTNIPGDSSGWTNNYKNGLLCQYTESNGNYKLTEIPAARTKAVTTVQQGKATLTSGSIADSKTIFIVKNGSAYNVYTGIANVPTMKVVTATAANGVKADGTTDNGVAECVVVTSGAPTVTKSIYVLDSKVTKAWEDGKTIYTVPALVDGEYEELQLSNVGSNLIVNTGLYTGNGVVLTSGKVDADILRGDVTTGVNHFAGAKLSELTNENLTASTVKPAANSLASTATTIETATTTLVEDTRYIIIENGKGDEDEVKVIEGSAGDLVYDKDDGRYDSVVIVVRAGDDDDTAAYYQAGIVYIIR